MTETRFFNSFGPSSISFTLFLLLVREPDMSAMSYTVIDVLSNGTVVWGYGSFDLPPGGSYPTDPATL